MKYLKHSLENSTFLLFLVARAQNYVLKSYLEFQASAQDLVSQVKRILLPVHMQG